MIAVADALDVISRHSHALPTETVALADAHGRVLREPVVSAEDLPPFDRSAMDGYAVREDDSADELQVIDEIRAGEAKDITVRPGQAVRILTGARLPSAGLIVVMQEHVEARDSRIRIVKRGDKSNVRLRGEDARVGEVLLEPRTLLDATSLALLASIGKTAVQVTKRPRVLHITTGDEIVAPEVTPAEGQLRNSNASLIGALCREQGVALIDHQHAPDDLEKLLLIADRADAPSYELVLISGGSGQGSYDFSAELFRHLGAEIQFREVNVRPGKPLIFGVARNQIVFGLPGNALSHFVCFHLFVRRVLERLLGRAESAAVRGILTEPMADTMNARETWWPARAELKDGRLECRALAWKSSGDITRLPAARALVKVPASTSRLDAGTMVELLPTRAF